MHRYPRWPIHLALLGVSFIMLVPFYWVLKTSVSGENIFAYPPSMIPKNPHLFYYVDVWYYIPFARYFLNSVIVSVLCVGANVVFNAMAGYALTRGFAGKSLAQRAAGDEKNEDGADGCGNNCGDAAPKPTEQEAARNGHHRTAGERQGDDDGIKADKGEDTQHGVFGDQGGKFSATCGKLFQSEVALPSHGENEGTCANQKEQRPKSLEPGARLACMMRHLAHPSDLS